MDTVIRSIRTPQHFIAAGDRLESTESEIIKALLSKDSVFDGETHHTFEDVLQSVWSVDSDAEQIDAELKNIAMGDSSSIENIQNILTIAAEKYAVSISKKVIEYRVKEDAADYIASMNTDEFQNIRGYV
jgi:hypothetical protein